MTAGEFEEVVAAKVSGAAHLDALLDDDSLEAFVLFSSVSAVWGGGGQGAYAAANTFLDGLAERRRADGRVATSVAWGPWAGDGMAATGDVVEQLKRRGLSAMDPAIAVDALSEAVRHGETTVAVSDMDWNRFLPGFTAVRPAPLFSELPAAEPVEELAEPDLPVRLSGLPANDQLRLLLDLVRSEAATVLGHARSGAVEADRAFKELGFDSLTAVELRNRLLAATGLKLPATLVFDHSTPVALAEHLRGELSQDGRPAGSEIDRLEAVLSTMDSAEAARSGVADRLRALLFRWEQPAEIEQTGDLKSASDDEIFEFLGKEFGIS
jgi:acyl carrier protein